MTNTDKIMFAIKEAALKKAQNELSYAIYLSDCGKNAGIRKINANKVEWLKWVVYLAQLVVATENKPTVEELK